MFIERKAPKGEAPRLQRRRVDVAVVIPAYKQSGFLPEALESVLGQNATIDVAAVVVNDGCPFPQTARTGLDYSRAHPDRVFYLERENGGLSAARNTGVDFALGAFPECSAVFFLDADNRLFPDFIQRAWNALLSSDERIGWIYPDMDMFGMPQNRTVRGPYSVLMHLLENYCEAGSLVSRRVFEAGVKFDERMRQGFEDWEFWLQAAKAGFRGRHLPYAGFRYRRRAESMLAHSERSRESILAYMRKKHEDMLRPGALLALEAEELPRFAIHEIDKSVVSFVVDPVRPPGEYLTPPTSREQLIKARRNPGSAACPRIKCFAETGVLDGLRRWRLIRNVFWCAQRLLQEAHLVFVRILASPRGEIVMNAGIHGEGAARIDEACLIFARSDVLADCATENSSAWLASVRSAQPGPCLGEIEIRLPGEEDSDHFQPSHSLVDSLFFEVASLRSLFKQCAPAPAEWRPDTRIPRSDSARAYKLFCGTAVMFPHLSAPGEINVGFVLPLMEFGGVEKVILNYAASLGKAGFRPHLFITGATALRTPVEAAAVFESVNFLADGAFESAQGTQRYFGARTSGQDRDDALRNALGLMATMQVVVNTHSLGAHGVMAFLRAQGVKTFLGLHLVERASTGQPIGNPHLALAYEYAYDGIIVISEQLRDWCLGQAIPPAKVFRIENAPSYPVDPDKLRRALESRGQRAATCLNVLYLGRLDLQKGLDRLAAVIRATASPEIRWRIVGKSVLDGANAELEGLPVAVEEPVFTAGELDALYKWADVLVLCSRFEGVPLTILEAQRFGCVVVATDVGAVSEIVSHESTGLLIDVDRSEDEIVANFAAALRGLLSDRYRLREIGLRAAARVATVNWEANIREWVAELSILTGTSKTP